MCLCDEAALHSFSCARFPIHSTLIANNILVGLFFFWLINIWHVQRCWIIVKGKFYALNFFFELCFCCCRLDLLLAVRALAWVRDPAEATSIIIITINSRYQQQQQEEEDNSLKIWWWTAHSTSIINDRQDAVVVVGACPSVLNRRRPVANSRTPSTRWMPAWNLIRPYQVRGFCSKVNLFFFIKRKTNFWKIRGGCCRVGTWGGRTQSFFSFWLLLLWVGNYSNRLLKEKNETFFFDSMMMMVFHHGCATSIYFILNGFSSRVKYQREKESLKWTNRTGKKIY